MRHIYLWNNLLILFEYENHELFLTKTDGGLANFFAELIYALTNFLLTFEVEHYFF